MAAEKGKLKMLGVSFAEDKLEPFLRRRKSWGSWWNAMRLIVAS
jgi:hypothetical protein